MNRSNLNAGFRRTLQFFAAACAIALLGMAVLPGGGAQARKRTSAEAKSNGIATLLPSCGRPDDGKVHLPPDWTSFRTPQAGGSYVDPVFGCTVVRITSSGSEETLWNGKHPGFMNYYSTLSAMNATDTMLLISSTDGAWRVKNTKGELVVSTANMPKMNDGHPVWDAADGNVFYFAEGNKLEKATISGEKTKISVLHTFHEYQGVGSPDAADLSQDGDHIALAGQNANRTIDIFAWSLSRNIKTSTYTTQCEVNQWGVAETTQPACLHKLQFTPDAQLLLQFAQDGTEPEQGLRLWHDGQLLHMQDHTNHTDTGYDLEGRPVFIEAGGPGTLEGENNPCPSRWGLDVRQIADLAAASCLLDKQPAFHVSYRGGPLQPWAALSFFDDRVRGPEFLNNGPKFEAASENNWKLYEDEIIVARIDGRGVYRLAQARSRSSEGYWNQPHAAISRDGKYIVFTSDMAHPNGCPADMQVPDECTDVYLIKAF